eukprot:TRINITY_DN34523_c0_g1_i1.p1 TRINITY_DN34523_c0_g1~~TRINITY_DN34523_c0_g1_i1.p1  ORF type:complete len:232 (+),score=45.98 TRINITY_DN34523_c0_g1_i1:51-746(+)
MPRRQSQAWLNSGATLRRPGDWVCECDCRNQRWMGSCQNCGKSAKVSEQPSGWDLALKGWRTSRARAQQEQVKKEVQGHHVPQSVAVPPRAASAAAPCMYPVCYIPVIPTMVPMAAPAPTPPAAIPVRQQPSPIKTPPTQEEETKVSEESRLVRAPSAGGVEWMKSFLTDAYDSEPEDEEDEPSCEEVTPGPVTPQEEPSRKNSTAELNRLFVDLLNMKLVDGKFEEDLNF